MNQLLTEDRFMRLREVTQKTSLSRTTIYRKIKHGDFPSYVKLGQLSVWRESAINKWMDSVSGQQN